MKKATMSLLIGLLLGTMLAGPAVEAASGILAERSTQAVFVNGVPVELEAYNINGSNYVKLRDVGETLNFEVYWDGAAVQIDSTAPYTGEAPEVKQTDYSTAANPAVFTDLYTREFYNAAHVVREAAKIGDLSRFESFHISAGQDRWRLEGALGDIADSVTLTTEATDPHGGYKVHAIKTDRSAADAATDALIRKANALSSDKEKVRLFNEYLCEKISYDGKTLVGINEISMSQYPVNGSCAAFSAALNYLCGKVNIPCIRVHGESHFWNAVYCDGAWSYVDVSLNDQVSGHAGLLFSQTPPKQSSDPEAVRFLEELLVPGSTM